jgi:hypothetical protein
MPGSPLSTGLNRTALRLKDSLRRILVALRRRRTAQMALYPESLHQVECTDEGVTWQPPGGEPRTIPWTQLQRVDVVTNDLGPFASDVHWLLHSADVQMMIPQGATGERELLGRLQQLPGFDNDALIRAMGSTDNAVFPCWPAGAGQPGPPE